MEQKDKELLIKDLCARVKEDSVDILDALANDLDAIDRLNTHHFDYRDLIEKGLAIEVTKDNNPYEN